MNIGRLKKVKSKILSLISAIFLISCSFSLTACDKYGNLDTVEIDPTVIAVTHLQGATVGISQQRIYILDGTYRVLMDGKYVDLPAGICVDVGTWKLHKFNVEQFIKLYESKMNPSNNVKIIG